jgi:hypothetical protein
LEHAVPLDGAGDALDQDALIVGVARDPGS